MSVTAVPILPTKRSYIVYIWIGLAIAVAGAFLLARQGDDFWSQSQRAWDIQTTATGLKYQIIKPGEGKSPTDTDVALVNYEGRLRNGKTFDKSQQPSPMPVKGVVPGFSEALKLMNKGAKIRVWIPAALAYGAEEKKNQQTGEVVIPANSPLMFDIELLEFLPQSVVEQYQQQMMNGGGGPGGPGGAPGGPGGVGGPPPGGPGGLPSGK